MGSEWREVPLGEFLTFQRGFDLPIKDRVAGTYPVVASTGRVGTHNHAMVSGPGVVIGRSGSLGGGQYIQDDFWPLNTTLWVKDFKGNHPLFCYYLIKSIDFKRFNVGSGVPTLNRNHIHVLPITTPPLPEQRAIAHILGSLDDKIELNRRMNRTLEAMAQAIFKSWFADFDPVRAKAEGRDTGLPKEIAALFPDGFEDSELGEIPRGWEVKQLSDVCIELRRGISPKYTNAGGVQVINQRCIRNHAIDFTQTKRNDVHQRRIDGRLIELGDVLINSTGVGTLGRVAPILHLNEPTVVDSHVTVARTHPQSFLSKVFWMMMLDLEPTIQTMGEGSTGQTELSRKRLGTLSVLVPPLSVQRKMEHLIAPLFKQRVASEKQSGVLATLLDTLLPKLISGELRVPDAEQFLKEAGL